eukprot:2793442-Amphidinium_carterae.1
MFEPVISFVALFGELWGGDSGTTSLGPYIAFPEAPWYLNQNQPSLKHHQAWNLKEAGTKAAPR